MDREAFKGWLSCTAQYGTFYGREQAEDVAPEVLGAFLDALREGVSG